MHKSYIIKCSKIFKIDLYHLNTYKIFKHWILQFLPYLIELHSLHKGGRMSLMSSAVNYSDKVCDKNRRYLGKNVYWFSRNTIKVQSATHDLYLVGYKEKLCAFTGPCYIDICELDANLMHFGVRKVSPSL